ncbi:hypothetical protein QUB05_19910 [Microcoleus sp. F10-C6]|uniref:hypothetical protein n=2 Tax=unclassified Microcoleus TaxID=2642155 RepID=UPI002FD145F5
MIIQDYQTLESKIDRMTQDYLSKREKLALTIGVVGQGHHYIKGFGNLSDTVSAIPNAGTIYQKIGSKAPSF